jgi:branched-chain amino acid transport system permease protein
VSSFLQFTLSGATNGFVYVLLALGWVIVYRVSGIVNLTQGNLLVLGGLTAVTLAQNHAWPVWLAMVAGVLAAGVTGGLFDIVILQRARTNNAITLIVMTLGAAILAGELFEVLFGVNPLIMQSFLPTRPWSVGGASVQPVQVLVWGVAIVALLVLTLFFETTITGKALEACAQSSEGASLMGISVKRMRVIAFTVGGLVSGLGGVLLCTLVPMTFSEGILLGAKGLTVAILANWSYRYVVVAGMFVALSEAYAVGYIASQWEDIVSMGLLVAVLLFRATNTSLRSFLLARRERHLPLTVETAEAA